MSTRRRNPRAAACLASLLLFFPPDQSFGMGQNPNARTIIEQVESSGLEPEIHAVIEFETMTAPPASHPALEGIEIAAPAGSAPFALDGSGGTYHVLPDGRILLIDSEGSAGVVAPNFKEFIAIAAGLPGWRDALKFVGRQDVATARADWQAFIAKWKLESQLHQPWPYAADHLTIRTPALAREAIMNYFHAPSLSDPFGALYHAVNSLNDDVGVKWEGERLRLFGR
ncbi:hypothetical protein [Chelatococcus reniformis]|nr:hypothetical protein [Chelatococcus reniformis]